MTMTVLSLCLYFTLVVIFDLVDIFVTKNPKTVSIFERCIDSIGFSIFWAIYLT
jgi:hypothetical protein